MTRPIELEMFGLPGLEQVRSLTRFGVSQVCLIFSDGTDLYQARQMVTERLAHAVDKLPRGLSPKLAPPSSGLGEVFTYALAFKPNSAPATNSVEARLRRLKLMQEFVVKPCLKSVKGVAEVNTTGGYDQQMVVEVDPAKLTPARLLDLNDIANIVERDAAIGGGALVERDGHQFIIRSRSRAQTITELTNLCIKLPWALMGPAVEQRGHGQPRLEYSTRRRHAQRRGGRAGHGDDVDGGKRARGRAILPPGPGRSPEPAAVGHGASAALRPGRTG